MDIKSFKEWYLKTQRVEGECNCWLPERFDDMITSTETDFILELCELMSQYIKYTNNLRLQFNN